MAYKPILGGQFDPSFLPQFADAKVDTTSLSVTLIEHLSHDGADTVLSHGTGFFWRANNKVYLVTARHVLSGLNPFDDSLMSPQGFIPRRLNIYPTIEVAPGHEKRVKTVLDLGDEPAPGWLEDPYFETLRTDIAAVPLVLAGKVHCLNDTPDNFQPIFTHVGMDCAVVGYPTTAFAGLMTPIWRRGTIASEPLLPIDNKPMFLLDAATSPGFSGSPVFRRHIGPAPVQNEDGSLGILVERVLTTSFVGVYAGRLEHAYVGGEVPFVFYGNRLPLMLK